MDVLLTPGGTTTHASASAKPHNPASRISTGTTSAANVSVLHLISVLKDNTGTPETADANAKSKNARVASTGT